MWFSSKPTPPPSETPTSEFSDLPQSSTPVVTASADSDSIKKALIKQILLESNSANARLLMEKINENCFEKCVPNPGGSLSASESTCVTQCMEKYMSAWNHINAAYMRRIQETGASR